MTQSNDALSAQPSILDQLTDELHYYNRGLITELPRWMY